MTQTHTTTEKTCPSCEGKGPGHARGAHAGHTDHTTHGGHTGHSTERAHAGHATHGGHTGDTTDAAAEPPVSWLATYKPILLVFAYIVGGTLLPEVVHRSWDGMRWMSHFMAVFFLVFSFFKLLDIPAFADSYRSYDVIAGRWRGWGVVYPFVELGLGVLFLTGFDPLFTNTATLIVMGVSIIGVIRSVLHKRKIQCACLGAVFNLPISTITIIEDGLMIGMSGYSILTMISRF
ncbi:MAG TPA: MauE/DoxX family redox-associated membrane protein [Puia sp.]|nr:MauE/DoxX family redox-associated membrane protein [Puia sp.]